MKWIPVRKILRRAFGVGNYRLLRTGEIEVKGEDDAWRVAGSLTNEETLRWLQALLG